MIFGFFVLVFRLFFGGFRHSWVIFVCERLDISMVIMKNNFRISRPDGGFSPGSGGSVSSEEVEDEEDVLRRKRSAAAREVNDDGGDDDDVTDVDSVGVR